ncbi:MAG: hypothetical protein WCC54_06425, partial [Pseudolabrys sp.]
WLEHYNDPDIQPPSGRDDQPYLENMTVVQSGGLSRVHCWHKADIEDYRRFALGHYWTVVQLPPEPSCGFDRNRVTATEFLFV